MKKVSLSTIAKELNVSTVTVHKALKKQSGVSTELRKKILELADQLGYVYTDASAQHHFIYIIDQAFLLSTNEQYYSVIYYHLNNKCAALGHTLHLIVHSAISSTLSSIRITSQEFKIEGLFVLGQVGKDLLTEIEKMKKPVVCIDFYSSDFHFNYVYPDNYYAGYSLTKYLIGRGHRRICFVGDIKFSNAIADRYFGYLRALNKYNLPIPGFHINSNVERLPSMPDLNFHDMPTAFICHCDRAASVLYAYFNKAGYKIPEDVSIVGFDNTDSCEFLSPRLSSIGIDKEVFATQALLLMENALEKTSRELDYIKLNLALYERDSVADLRQ